jgi:phosphoadenosine phosphosulfate reductase
VPVIFLDTGYHFAETIGTRDAVVHRYDITLVNARPKQTVAEQDLTLLPNLYSINPDLCCSLRKVAPFSAALGPYSAWASGIRRDESVTRRHAPVVSVDRRGKVKVNPLVSWTHEDLDSYAADNDVIVNPLLHDGYPSIGCAPCTHRVNGGDLRSGRWVGRAKTECGLHS